MVTSARSESMKMMGFRVFLKWILKVASPKWSRIILLSFWAILLMTFTIKTTPPPDPIRPRIQKFRGFPIGAQKGFMAWFSNNSLSHGNCVCLCLGGLLGHLQLQNHPGTIVEFCRALENSQTIAHDTRTNRSWKHMFSKLLVATLEKSGARAKEVCRSY